MASIYAKRGILYLTYYIEDEYGRRQQKSHSLEIKDNRENRKIAKIIKAEKEAELVKPNTRVIKYKLTLADAIKIYLKEKNNVSNKTKEIYKISFKHLLNFFNSKKNVNDLNQKDVNKYILYLENEIGLSKNSIASYIKDAKTLWNWLIKNEIVIKNVFPSLKQEPKEIRYILDEDFEIILKYLFQNNIEQFRFINFLRLTGFRISEALELKWEDIDFRTKKILLNNVKMKRKDSFPLFEELENFLKTFLHKEGKVFGYKSKDSLHFWPRLMRKLNMKYNLHSIRKTFATKLVNNNVSVFDAMKLLRHKKVDTTIKYYTSADLMRLGNEANKVFSGKYYSNLNQTEVITNKKLKVIKLGM